MKTKILFIGTADFGVPVLEALANNKENEIKAITQPDRKGGRGKKIIFSPIKKIAILKKIDLYRANKNRLKKIRDILTRVIHPC